MPPEGEVFLTELREVRILIGKRNYRVQTALDDGSLARVTSLVTDIAKGIGDGMDQENLLFFTCLNLAYSLEKISRRLNGLLDDLDTESPDL